MVTLTLLAQSASRTLDPPGTQAPGLLTPFVAIVAVVALIVAIAAFMRSRRTDE
jgi:hypothetical protein